MAALNRVPIKPCNTASVRKREGGATASQTWVRGAVLIAASGRLSEGGTNPTEIVGVALHGVTSATADDVAQYVPTDNGQEFIASLDDSSDLGNGALAIAQKYVKYGITEDSSGIWYVDINKTTDATVRVIVTELIDEVGDTSGRVRCRFINGISDVGGTAVPLTIYAGTV